MSWTGALIAAIFGGVLARLFDPEVFSRPRQSIRDARDQDRQAQADHDREIAHIRAENDRIAAETAVLRADNEREQAKLDATRGKWQNVKEFLEWLETQPEEVRVVVGREVRSLAEDPSDTESFAEAFRVYVGGDITGDIK